MSDPTTLLFLGIFVFVAFRLYSVLGTRSGEEENHMRKDDWTMGNPNSSEQENSLEEADYTQPTNDPADEAPEDNVVTLPNRSKAAQRVNEIAAEQRAKIIEKFAKADTQLAEGLDELMQDDASFDPKEFINGARMAYEMIVTAFADGDRRTLKNLLSSDVYDSFAAVIDQRERDGEYVESVFVGVEKANFLNVAIKADEAQIELGFTSQLISVTRNQEGEAIEGDPEEVAEVKDEWTFARQISSNDPNWKLIAT